MSNKNANNVAAIVSNEILIQQGRFTVDTIVNKVKDLIINVFETIDKIFIYVKEKMDYMCEYGMIGKTELYYYID